MLIPIKKSQPLGDLILMKRNKCSALTISSPQTLVPFLSFLGFIVHNKWLPLNWVKVGGQQLRASLACPSLRRPAPTDTSPVLQDGREDEKN